MSSWHTGLWAEGSHGSHPAAWSGALVTSQAAFMGERIPQANLPSPGLATGHQEVRRQCSRLGQAFVAVPLSGIFWGPLLPLELTSQARQPAPPGLGSASLVLAPRVC